MPQARALFRDDGASLTPAPPLANLPNRGGRDPHEDVRSTPAARTQKAMFLKIGGAVIDPRGGKACHTSAFMP